MKVVIDTNVWVSGLLWRGTPNQILQKIRQGRLQALLTQPLLNEIARTFTYPKLQGRLQQLHETPDSLLIAVQELTQPCVAVRLIEPGLRDLEDLVVLEAAVGGEAAAIVTGDRDLLVLIEFSGIPIVTPQDFLQTYFSEEEKTQKPN